jgi:hypothetical protein
LLVRGMIRITRHRAIHYQIPTTRGGWVRLSDVRAKLMNEFSQKSGFLTAQQYVTHDRLIDLVVNADKPRLGLLREANSKAYTWVRAWTKHEGLSVKKDGYEQRIEHPDEVPRSAVSPTKWTTFERHICRAGLKGPSPFRPQGGGDAPWGQAANQQAGNVRLLIGPCDYMRPGESGIRMYSDTMLIVNLKQLIEGDVPVFISAVPAKWLNIVVNAVIDPKYIIAVNGIYTGKWYNAPQYTKDCFDRIPQVLLT